MARELQAFVFIYLPGETVAVPAGVFTLYPDDGIGRFSYGRRYLERRTAVPVDPVALPLGTRTREVSTNGGLFGAFRDASPDYWGRLVLAADAKVPPEALGEMDYLLRGNASRAGNVDFRTSLEQGEAEGGPPAFRSLRDLVKAAFALQEGGSVGPDLLRLLEQGSSVGGARPKCTVELDNALWIAKFPAKGDVLNYPRIEHATMALAKRCGIAIPETRLADVGGRDVLLVKRFDRKKTARGYLRSGFMSALSIAEWDELDRAAWSYPVLADRMRLATLARPDQIRELFRRMVFNVLCRNTDDHPRNHGFVHGARGYALSPAYDIVPTPARPGVGTDFALSMTLGAEGRAATLKNALSLSPRFGLEVREAKKVVAGMKAKAARWEKHFRALGVSPADTEAAGASFALATG